MASKPVDTFPKIEERLNAGRAERWGTNALPCLLRLEAFRGGPLSADLRDFALRYGNLNIHPAQIELLGLEGEEPLAVQLTETQREVWEDMPSRSLVIGRMYADLFVLHGDDTIGVYDTDFSPQKPPRSRLFPAFSSFLDWLLDLTGDLEY
ncbi:MAG: hypothetical protein JNK60_06265 [Acidobacteria bacterium]|nr:hypothetical protein [Acidobacteriota bacterium]